MLATEPAEILGEVAHSDVQRCSIEQRPLVLKNLELDEGSLFISDVFLQTGSTFNPSEKVHVSFVCVSQSFSGEFEYMDFKENKKCLRKS